MSEHWGEISTPKKFTFRDRKPLIVPYPEEKLELTGDSFVLDPRLKRKRKA